MRYHRISRGEKKIKFKMIKRKHDVRQQIESLHRVKKQAEEIIKHKV